MLINLKKSMNIDKALLWIFLLTLFLVWSPIDFWKFLPHVVAIMQFAYRFLAQLMWAGSLLVSVAIASLINSPRPMQILCVEVLIISLSSIGWLMTYSTAAVTVDGIKQMAVAGWAQTDYLLKELFFFNANFSNNQKLTTDEKLNPYYSSVLPTLNFKEMQKNCVKLGQKRHCCLSVSNPGLFKFPFIYYPDLLNVVVDGQKKIDYMPSRTKNYWLVKLPLSTGTYVVTITVAGLVWTNWFSGLAWFVLVAVFSISLIKRKYLNLSLAKKFNLT